MYNYSQIPVYPGDIQGPHCQRRQFFTHQDVVFAIRKSVVAEVLTPSDSTLHEATRSLLGHY